MLRQSLIALSLLVILMSGCAAPEKTKTIKTEPKEQAKQMSEETNKYTEAVIETNKGSITFKFYKEDAPNTVDNFVKLVEKNFYDGLTWHRVVPGFVIQGGCPKGDGTGGPGYNVKAEFNSRPHLIGTVAMARAMDPDSAGSQFYICLGAQPSLDNKYTVFGQVSEGQDVVNSIVVGDSIKKIIVK